MPLSKKTSKYKLKFKTKPQITSGLMLLKMFFHLKEPWCEIIVTTSTKLQKNVIHSSEMRQTKPSMYIKRTLSLTGITIIQETKH